MCAGPFSQQLMGLSTEANRRLELALLDKHEVRLCSASCLQHTWCMLLSVTFIVEL
jgi:hypothetical protein